MARLSSALGAAEPSGDAAPPGGPKEIAADIYVYVHPNRPSPGARDLLCEWADTHQVPEIGCVARTV